VRLFKWFNSDLQARKFQEFIQAFGKSLMNSEVMKNKNKKARVTIYNYRPPLAGEINDLINDVAELSEEDTCDEHSVTGEADSTAKEAKAKLHQHTSNHRSSYEHYSTSSVL